MLLQQFDSKKSYHKLQIVQKDSISAALATGVDEVQNRGILKVLAIKP
jgi:hypothetical protein